MRTHTDEAEDARSDRLRFIECVRADDDGGKEKVRRGKFLAKNCFFENLWGVEIGFGKL